MPEFKIPEDFCYHNDLQDAAKLITLVSKNQLTGAAKDRFEWLDGFTVGFNQNSGVCYAYDEYGNVINEQGELFYTTGWSGQEGTMDEHIENIINFDDYEKDDMEDVLAVFEEYMTPDQIKDIQDRIDNY